MLKSSVIVSRQGLTLLLALCLLFQAFIQLLDYRRGFICHSMPDYIEINIEIAMDEAVTHVHTVPLLRL